MSGTLKKAPAGASTQEGRYGLAKLSGFVRLLSVPSFLWATRATGVRLLGIVGDQNTGLWFFWYSGRVFYNGHQHGNT